jgi:hypothetical protein
LIIVLIFNSSKVVYNSRKNCLYVNLKDGIYA